MLEEEGDEAEGGEATEDDEDEVSGGVRLPAPLLLLLPGEGGVCWARSPVVVMTLAAALLPPLLLLLCHLLEAPP